MDNSHLSILAELGLSDKESRVYLAVLELGSASVGSIAERSGIKRTSVYNFIDRLVELGIISQSLSNAGKVYNAVSPSSLVELQEKRLRLVKERLGELAALTNLAGDKPRIQYFEGTKQMQQLSRYELACNKELLGIWNRKRVIEQLGGKEVLEELDRERRKKGIYIRVIVVEEEDIMFKGGDNEPGDMREIRYAPKGMSFPAGISVYDNGKVAFYTSKDEAIGILIESKELEATMRQLFEAFWQISTPKK